MTLHSKSLFNFSISCEKGIRKVLQQRLGQLNLQNNETNFVGREAWRALGPGPRFWMRRGMVGNCGIEGSRRSATLKTFQTVEDAQSDFNYNYNRRLGGGKLSTASDFFSYLSFTFGPRVSDFQNCNSNYTFIKSQSKIIHFLNKLS